MVVAVLYEWSYSLVAMATSYSVPLQDLCWYNAHKTDHPEQKGTIPVTHVTLVYMSDDGMWTIYMCRDFSARGGTLGLLHFRGG